jgi:hypothetical protein
MDGKNFFARNSDGLKNVPISKPLGQARPVSSSFLFASSLESFKSEAVIIETNSSNFSQSKNSDELARTNRLASATNLASEATETIKELISSLEEIVGIATSDKVPNTITELEIKANKILNEINAKIESSAIVPQTALLDDNIKFELEQELGKTLDFIFLEDTKDNLGIGSISFASKDSIINTVYSVRTARERIDSFANSLDDLRNSIGRKLSEREVARQNIEASGTSVRDLEEAFTLAEITKESIGKNPLLALGSAGNFTKRAPDLLK